MKFKTWQDDFHSELNILFTGKMRQNMSTREFIMNLHIRLTSSIIITKQIVCDKKLLCFTETWLDEYIDNENIATLSSALN